MSEAVDKAIEDMPQNYYIHSFLEQHQNEVRI